MNSGDSNQYKADHIAPSSGSSGVVSFHSEKMDIPQFGKKVSNVPNPTMGGTIPAHKVDNQNDALGNPGRYPKQTEFNATETDKSKLVACREKQLGSNGYQGN